MAFREKKRTPKRLKTGESRKFLVLLQIFPINSQELRSTIEVIAFLFQAVLFSLYHRFSFAAEFSQSKESPP